MDEEQRIEDVESAIHEFEKKARAGYFKAEIVVPMLERLRDGVDNSPIRKNGVPVCKKILKSVNEKLKDGPVILEDFNARLYVNKKSLLSMCKKWRIKNSKAEEPIITE
jgi:hypothetical protein